MAGDETSRWELYQMLKADGYYNGDFAHFTQNIDNKQGRHELWQMLTDDNYYNGTEDEFNTILTKRAQARAKNPANTVTDDNWRSIATGGGFDMTDTKVAKPKSVQQTVHDNMQVVKPAPEKVNVGAGQNPDAEEINDVAQAAMNGENKQMKSEQEGYVPTEEEQAYTATANIVGTPEGNTSIDTGNRGEQTANDAYDNIEAQRAEEAQQVQYEDNMDELYDTVSRDYDASVKADASNNPSAFYGTTPMSVGRQATSDKTNNLAAAKAQLEEARTMRENARRYAQESNGFVRFVKDFGYSFYNTATDLSTWDFGLKDANSINAVRRTLDKVDKQGEESLTDDEKQLLDAVVMNTAAKAYYGSQQGMGNDVGATSAQMIPFMIEMMMSPANSIGKASSEALKRGIRKYATAMLKRGAIRSAVKNLATREGLKAATQTAIRGAKIVGKNIAYDTVKGYMMAATTGMGRTAADVEQRRIGDVQLDNNGTGSYIGRTDKEGVATAVAKALTAQSFEYSSEFAGDNYIEPLVTTMKGLAKGFMGRAAEKIATTTAGKLMERYLGGITKLYNRIIGTTTYNTLSTIYKRGHYNDNFTEYLEEVLNNVENAAFVGDMTFDTDPNTGVFNAEMNIKTALGVSVPSIFKGVASGADYAMHKGYFSARTAKSERSAGKLFGERWSDIKASIDALDFSDLDEACTKASDIVSKTCRTKAEASALSKYFTSVADAATYEIAVQARLKEEEDDVDNARETAEGVGMELSTPEELNDAGRNMQKADAVLEKLDPNLKATLEQYLNENASSGEIASLLSGLEDKQRKIANDYITARSIITGVQKKIQESVKKAVERQSKLVTPYTDAEGNFTIAGYDGLTVFVKERQGNTLTVDIYYDDGTKETRMIDVSALDKDDENNPDILTQNTKEYLKQFEKMNLDALMDDAENDLNNNRNTVTDIKNGTTFTIADGDNSAQLQIVGQNEQDGTFDAAPLEPEYNDETGAIEYTPNLSKITKGTAEDFINMQNEYWNGPLEEEEEENADEGESVTDEKPTETPAEKAAESGETPSEKEDTSSNITYDESEEPVFDNASEDEIADFYDQSGLTADEANQFIQGGIDKANKQLADLGTEAKVEGGAPKIADYPGKPMAYAKAKKEYEQKKADAQAEWEQKRDKAQANVTKWVNARNKFVAKQADKAKEANAKALFESDRASNDDKDAALGAPQSLQEFVARQAYTFRYLWEDKKDGTQGMRSELFGKNSTIERGKRLAFLSNDEGLTVKEVAEQITQQAKETGLFGQEIDDQDVYNMLIDVLTTYENRGAILKDIYASRQAAAEAQARQQEESASGQGGEDFDFEGLVKWQEQNENDENVLESDVNKGRLDDNTANDAINEHNDRMEKRDEEESALSSDILLGQRLDEATASAAISAEEADKETPKATGDEIDSYSRDDMTAIIESAMREQNDDRTDKLNDLTDDQMREMVRAYIAWEEVNDEFGRIADEQEQNLKSEDKAVKAKAQAIVDEAERKSVEAFRPFEELYDKYIGKEEEEQTPQQVLDALVAKYPETLGIDVPKGTAMNEDGYVLATDDEGNTSTTLYHGTLADIKSVKDLRAGMKRVDGDKASFNGEGISFAPDKSVALDYSNGDESHVLEGRVKLDKPYYTLGNTFPSDEEGAKEAKAFSDALKALGYDGIINLDTPTKREMREVVVFDSKNIEEAPEEDKELDENGHPFVVGKNGSTELGHIKSETGLREAPIKLSEGTLDYGLAHIEARHGDQIRNAGFASVVDFVESVASNYNTIKKGNTYLDGKQTYLLEITDKKNNTLYIELSRDGSYWNVNSAGVFKKSYSAKKEVIWSLPTVENESSAASSEVSHSSDNGRTNDEQSGDSSQMTSSGSKGSNNIANGQTNVEENGEKDGNNDKKNEPNRLVSDERMAQLAQELMRRLGGLKEADNVEKIDGSTLALGMELAVGIVERGASKFTDYATQMVNTLGDVVRPYLKAFYNGMRDLPEAVENGLSEQMDDYATVSKINVATFDKENPQIDIVKTAEVMSDEQKVNTTVKKPNVKNEANSLMGDLFSQDLSKPVENAPETSLKPAPKPTKNAMSNKDKVAYENIKKAWSGGDDKTEYNNDVANGSVFKVGDIYKNKKGEFITLNREAGDIFSYWDAEGHVLKNDGNNNGKLERLANSEKWVKIGNFYEDESSETPSAKTYESVNGAIDDNYGKDRVAGITPKDIKEGFVVYDGLTGRAHRVAKVENGKTWFNGKDSGNEMYPSSMRYEVDNANNSIEYIDLIAKEKMGMEAKHVFWQVALFASERQLNNNPDDTSVPTQSVYDHITSVINTNSTDEDIAREAKAMAEGLDKKSHDTAVSVFTKFMTMVRDNKVHDYSPYNMEWTATLSQMQAYHNWDDVKFDAAIKELERAKKKSENPAAQDEAIKALKDLKECVIYDKDRHVAETQPNMFGLSGREEQGELFDTTPTLPSADTHTLDSQEAIDKYVGHHVDLSTDGKGKGITDENKGFEWLDGVILAVGAYYESGRNVLAHGLKDGDESAIRESAVRMANVLRKKSHTMDDVVLVPMPNHTGDATYTLRLANEIGKLLGADVSDILEGAKRKTMYQARKDNALLSIDELGIKLKEGVKIDKKKNYTIIDNVVTSGTTAHAAQNAIGHCNFLVLADSTNRIAQQAASNQSEPNMFGLDTKEESKHTKEQMEKAVANSFRNLLKNNPHIVREGQEQYTQVNDLPDWVVGVDKQKIWDKVMAEIKAVDMSKSKFKKGDEVSLDGKHYFVYDVTTDGKRFYYDLTKVKDDAYSHDFSIHGVVGEAKLESVEASKENANLTPQMKQYYELKAKHPDATLLFRTGDFYEMYADDADAASKVLGITLTRHNTSTEKDGSKLRISVFPHHALDTYLPKLIRSGLRVAIVDPITEQKVPVGKNNKGVEIRTEKNNNGRDVTFYGKTLFIVDYSDKVYALFGLDDMMDECKEDEYEALQAALEPYTFGSKYELDTGYQGKGHRNMKAPADMISKKDAENIKSVDEIIKLFLNDRKAFMDKYDRYTMNPTEKRMIANVEKAKELAGKNKIIFNSIEGIGSMFVSGDDVAKAETMEGVRIEKKRFKDGSYGAYIYNGDSRVIDAANKAFGKNNFVMLSENDKSVEDAVNYWTSKQEESKEKVINGAVAKFKDEYNDAYTRHKNNASTASLSDEKKRETIESMQKLIDSDYERAVNEHNTVEYRNLMRKDIAVKKGIIDAYNELLQDNEPKKLEDMTDEELLEKMRSDGYEDSRYGNETTDEYDARHNDDYLTIFDQYTEYLDKEDKSIEEAQEILDDIEKEFRDGGYANDNRESLLGQMDATREYIDKKKALADRTKEEIANEEAANTPMTEEEIQNSDVPQELKDGALAYLKGNRTFVTQLAYQNVLDNVRNRPRNSAADSTDANGTQLGSQSHETGRSGSGRSGNEGLQVDGEGNKENVSGNEGNSANSVPHMAPSTRKTGNSNVRGEESSVDGVSSRSEHTNGGGTTRSNGHNVPSKRGDRVRKSVSGSDGKRTETDRERDKLADEINDLLAQFSKAANNGTLSISLVGMNNQQMQIAGQLLVKAAQFGYTYIKDGIRKAEEWTAKMKEIIGRPFQQVLNLTDAEVDELMLEIWDYPYTIDGKIKKLSVWASELGMERTRQEVRKTFAEKFEAQKAAESIKVKVGDADNIRETLPYLLPAQQEDVLKAETQFFDASHSDREHGFGKGYMFTNGTGTGKTYTGLGIIKRFIKQGKGRVLVLTPSQAKVNDWSNDAKNLGIELTKLDDTKSKGTGAVVTTFANFRTNSALMADDFDLIVYDEAHRIMESKKAEETIGAKQHYLISNKNVNYALDRMMMDSPLIEERDALDESSRELDLGDMFMYSHQMSQVNADQVKVLNKMLTLDFNGIKLTRDDFSTAALYKAITEHEKFTTNDRYGDAGESMHLLQQIYQKAIDKRRVELRKEIEEERKRLTPEAEKRVARTKVVFLSATPFNTRENLRYVEGYIFSYPKENESTKGSYNHRSPEQDFMETTFGAGYKWRYGELQKSIENAEALAQQERDFSDRLQNDLQTMSGRVIDSEYDYSRDFPTLTLERADDFNQALQDVFHDEDMRPLVQPFVSVFYNYNYSTALFESMKVALAIPRIEEHLKRGRKVVIFHRRQSSNGVTRLGKGRINLGLGTPFANALMLANSIKSSLDPKQNKDQIKEYEKAINKFKEKYAKLLEWERHLDYRLPREQLIDAFGAENVLLYSGQEKSKDKIQSIDDFNNDESGKNIIIIQEGSGKEGISLHDTTGKHQRVLMSLALPESPITFIQIEGRIYRIGNKSNAIFEYPLLGLDLETTLFASKFNSVVETSENLALGSKARGLREALANGVVEHSGDVDYDTQGEGGKEYDGSAQDGSIEPFDRAINDYYGQRKLSGRRDQREGDDYFPTPEPIGFKIVEWLQLDDTDRVLEPSAGHGAIARYVPKTNNMVCIEPSQRLMSKLQLAAGGTGRKFEDIFFENYDVHNKFDGIGMNPPYGAAGRTAIDHVALAFNHLNEGGRIVAIIPRGAADNKFDKWYNEQKDAVLVGEVNLPSCTFAKAGTSVYTRIVVIDKVTRPEMQSKASAHAVHVDLSNRETIEDLFEGIRDINMPERTIDNVVIQKKQATKTIKDFKDNKIVTYAFISEDDFGVRLRVGLKIKHLRLYDLTYDLVKDDGSKKGEIYWLGKYEIIKTADRNSMWASKYPAEWNEYLDTVIKTIENLSGMTADQMDKKLAEYRKAKENAKETSASPVAIANAVPKTEEKGRHRFEYKEGKHTKTGETLYTAVMSADSERLTDDEYKEVSAKAKANGGYWSRFAKSFVFKSEDSAKKFVDDVNKAEDSAVRFRRPSFVAGNGLGVYGDRTKTFGMDDYYYLALEDIATDPILFEKRMAVKKAAADAYKKFTGRKGGGKLAYESVYAPISEWRAVSNEDGTEDMQFGKWNFNVEDAKELWKMIEKPLRDYREELVANSYSQSKRFTQVYQTAIDEVDYAIKYYEAMANGEDVFDEGWEKPRFRANPVFVSNAENAVKAINQNKASGEQWLNMLKKNGGLKAEEDKWLGISDFLNGKKSVTKDELLQYIAENQLEVQDVEYVDFDEELHEEYMNGNKTATNANGQKLINGTRLDYTLNGLANQKEIALVVPTIEPYNQGDEVHFGDAGEGRAVAWVRFGDYTDADGKKVLVIDEIQSKRHQDGREKGYTDDAQRAIEELASFKNEMREKYGSLFDVPDEEQERYDRLFNAAYPTSFKPIPDAPFKKTWHELAMKRMLRYAAENGYDKIAWTDGATQANRYGLQNVLDDVYKDEYDSDDEQSQFTLTFKNENQEHITVDNASGKIIRGMGEGNTLSELVGKDVASQMMQIPIGETKSVGDFEIGGEGMKGFYDQMLPRFMNKYGKKWGIKVGTEHFDGLSDGSSGYSKNGGLDMWTIPVTDAMKESVMNGQTMFARAWHGSAADFDRFNLDFAFSGEGSMVNGYGVYVAELRGTGERYAQKSFEQKEARDKYNMHENPYDLSRALVRSWMKGGWNFNDALRKAKEKAETVRGYYREGTEAWNEKDKLVKAFDSITEENVKSNNKRMLYEVEIPDDKGDNYLDWNKELSDSELEYIVNRLRGSGKKMANALKEVETCIKYGEITGRDIYQGISVTLYDDVLFRGEEGNDKATSEYLHSIGYAGIKVPVGYNSGNAAKHEGNYNYVIFNADDVKIVSKQAFRPAEVLNLKHSTEEMDEMEKKVRELADELHVPVEVVRTYDEVEKILGVSTANKEILKKEGKGIYNTADGKVYVFLPNNVDASDACKTVLHEIVGHKGLRAMVGEKAYNNFLMTVYRGMPLDVRHEVSGRAIMEYGGDTYEAIDEYLAEKAEADETPTWWEKVKAALRQLLRRLGMDIKLNDNDVKYLLWQSKNQLKRGDIVTEAESRVMRSKLGVNRKSAESTADDSREVDEADAVRYRFVGEKGLRSNERKNKDKLDNLEIAKRMSAENVDDRKIKLATGWEKGADGKWRYEESDIKVQDKVFNGTYRGITKSAVAWRDILDRDSLDDLWWSGYHDLPRLVIIPSYRDGIEGTFKTFYGRKEIQLSIGRDHLISFDDSSYVTEYSFKLDEDVREVIAHEIQHFIQNKEGFAIGSNANGWEYKASAGEVEARNVQRRINMTDEERRNSLASDTEDVAREEQIVSFNSNTSYSRVTDKKRLDWFDKQPKITTYKTVAVDKNGEMHAPMADNVSGTKSLKNKVKTGNYTFGDVLEAEEHPELVDEKGQIKIQREDGKTLNVAYDPYDHSSDSYINDQFKSAWERDNLRVIEQEIAVGDLDEQYKADKALLPTGKHDWKKGYVGLRLPDNEARHVYLARWSRPVRFVDWQKVADEWIDKCTRNDIAVPFNVVPKAIRDIIADAGVEIIAPEKGMGKNCFDAYEEWKAGRNNPTPDGGGNTPAKGVRGKMGATRETRQEMGDVLRALYNRIKDFVMGKISEHDYKAMLGEMEKELSTIAPVHIVNENPSIATLMSLGYDRNDAKELKALAKKGFVGGYDPSTKQIIIFAVQMGRKNFKEFRNTFIHENFHAFLNAIKATNFDELDKFMEDTYKDKDARDLFAREYNETIAKDNNGDDCYEEWQRPEEFFTYIVANSIAEGRIDDLLSYATPFAEKIINNYLKTIGYEHKGQRTASNMRMGNVSANAQEGRGSETGRAQKKGIYGRTIATFTDGTNIVEKDSATARQMYERTLNNASYKFQEAWQDSMLGLKTLMNTVMKAEGKTFDDVADWENAYMAENLMSSVNAAEFEAYRKLLYDPMVKAVDTLIKDGVSYDDVLQYIVSKHGIERNEVFAMRDANRVAKEKVDYDRRMRKLDRDRASGDMDEDEYADAVSALEAELDSEVTPLYEENRKKDYSGLTALYKENNDESVADLENKAQEYVDNFEGKCGKEHIDDLWEKVNACNKATLDKQLQSGLINQVNYDLIKDEFSYYIPLRGFNEITSDEVYDYLQHRVSPMNEPIKSADGRTSLADDPIATIGNMAESGIMAGNRNLMKQKFLNFVQNHRSDIASVSEVYMQKVDTQSGGEWKIIGPEYTKDMSASDMEDKRAEFENWFNGMRRNDPEHYAVGRDKPNIPYRTLKQFAGEHLVILKRGGKPYMITINGNPRAAQAINGLTNPHGTQNEIFKKAESANRFMASMFTNRNPAFVIANFSRDAFYANSLVGIKEDAKYTKRFRVNWFIATGNTFKLVKKYKKNQLDMSNELDKAFYDFIMNGGETGFTSLNSVDEYRSLITEELNNRKRKSLDPRRALHLVDKWLDSFNRWAEDSSRFAAFLTSRQMGRSMQRSIFDAKEITVNFNKKGSGTSVRSDNNTLNPYLSQFAREAYIFFNAGVQGVANIYKAAKKNPSKFIKMGATYFALGMMMPAIGVTLSNLCGGDDDDYWDIPEYIRRNNLCLCLGKVTIKLPLPIELRMFYGLGELAYGQLTGNTNHKGGELVKKIAEQMSQIAPIDIMEGGGGISALVPSYIKPVYEIVVNTDWTGVPLEKRNDFNKNMPNWTKAYKGTSPVLINLAEAINEWTGGDDIAKGLIDLDPAWIEHLWEGYFGGFGTTLHQTGLLLEMLWNEDVRQIRNTPVVNRFLAGADTRAEQKRINNEYYENKEYMEEFIRRFNAYNKIMENSKNDTIKYAEYSEKCQKMMSSTDYTKYLIWSKLQEKLKEYEEKSKQLGGSDDIESQIFALKKMMNEEMRASDKNIKK